VGDEMIFTSYIVLALAWGICKGDKAPFFRERNQHGQIVKMPDEQEKNTLMVFTNDMCGTCKHVVPELDHVKRHYTYEYIPDSFGANRDANRPGRNHFSHPIRFQLREYYGHDWPIGRKSKLGGTNEYSHQTCGRGKNLPW
jgi:hypothetical protein